MQFSSTETYANRYDLDEIDVFLEGNFSNPMFFNVDGISKTFSFGKHYFTISILDSTNQQYQLRQNSRILFEFKSINNVVLRSDVVEINQRNGVVTCFFDVLRDPLRTRLETETLLGQYSFVKANISPLKTSKVGLTYSQKGTRGEGLPNQVMSLSSQNKGGSTS